MSDWPQNNGLKNKQVRNETTSIKTEWDWGQYLFTLPDSDSDYCTMQKFPIGSDSDSDPLIEM